MSSKSPSPSVSPDSIHQTEGSISFEQAFERLEKILESLNAGNITLDDSLKLYEEADRLINLCQKRLTDAERKIEVLMKNRSGDVVFGQDNKPQTQEMTFPSS